MKKTLIFLLTTMLLLNIVYAQVNITSTQQVTITQQQNQSDNGATTYQYNYTYTNNKQSNNSFNETKFKERFQEMRRLNEEKIENIRERIQEREEVFLAKKNITLKRINDKRLELKENGNIVRTRLNLSSEGNGSQLKIRLSNGRNAEIKIMPIVASQRAIQRLRIKVCNETKNNCTIELKQVGEGNKTRAVYEAKVKKMFRLFGFIKANREILTQIDAETGEEILTRRPWWAFLATEKEE